MTITPQKTPAKVGHATRRTSLVDAMIGERVRAIRLQRQLSQTDLATRIGITFQQVQKYEKGDNRLSLSRALKVCEVLDIEIATLLDGIGPQHKKRPNGLPSLAMAADRLGSEIIGLWSRIGVRDRPMIRDLALHLADR